MSGAVRVDLHVHTARYSQCAETLDPSRLAEVAAAARLDGVLITDHDVLWADEELELLRAACPGLKIYRGIEVSARGCHLVVAGVEEGAALDRGLELEEVVRITHAQGGAVILAHPYRDADLDRLPVERVDAVEVASTSVTRPEAVRARHLAHRLGLPMVAGSDAHALSKVGWAWTQFSSLPEDDAALAAAIRAGAGRPVAPHPFPR